MMLDLGEVIYLVVFALIYELELDKACCFLF